MVVMSAMDVLMQTTPAWQGRGQVLVAKSTGLHCAHNQKMDVVAGIIRIPLFI